MRRKHAIEEFKLHINVSAAEKKHWSILTWPTAAFTKWSSLVYEKIYLFCFVIIIIIIDNALLRYLWQK